jgi:uncharacterized protein (TIGR00369 family)
MSNADEQLNVHPLIQKRAEATISIEALLGILISDISDGRATGSLQPRPEHANPMGTLQGGALCSLVDATMGMAFASTLEADESFTTLDLQIHFFRPVWAARLRADAKVVQRSKNFGYLECQVIDDQGKQIARAASKCFILRGDAAQRR